MKPICLPEALDAPASAQADYLACLPSHEWVLHEARPLASGDVRWTERHLQCLWFDDRLRPAGLTTATGEPVEVIEPGRWNLEAGPDFLGAVLRVGRQAYRLEGDVEVHIRPADWTAHGHGRDSRFAGVVLHVTFFPGPAPDTLPRGTHQVFLAEPCRLTPQFCFDDIDLAAYPHAVLPLRARPCAEALGQDPERAAQLLCAAGRHRLWTKTQRMAARLRQTGDCHAVFFQEMLAGLGYKHNTAACRETARRVWPMLAADGEPPETFYARLLGQAGLLPAPDGCHDPEAAAFARHLWDRFWRAGAEPSPAAPPAWHLGHVRPLNHPLRRLAAAAALFAQPRACLDRLRALPTAIRPADWFRQAARLLSPPHVLPFWQTRTVFDQSAQTRTAALLGPARIAALLTNVVVPLLRAESRLPDAWLEHLPPEAESAPMREMAARLLGRDHDSALYARRGLRQQGLLQLHQDFCLRTREGCRDCPLPTRLPGRHSRI